MFKLTYTHSYNCSAAPSNHTELTCHLTRPDINEIEELTFGSLALKKLLSEYSFDTVLDVGCGEGLHTHLFRKHDKTVTAVDLAPGIQDAVTADYNKTEFEPHDCIWCCHVLEHQLNVNLFLTKVHRELKEGGIFAVTVPPLKHEVVGGHVNLWNGGLLIYNLVLAGFDCSAVSIKKYGYNISAILNKRSVQIPWNLNYDNGDLEKLAAFFPPFVHQAFNGDIEEYHWDSS